MAVFRVERTRDYTVMCNHHLKDSNLSLKAKGLLSMMLSLPDEWNYTTRGLAAICKEGVDAIGKTLKELELAGYIIRRQLRGKDGRISDTEYTIFEKPRKPSPPDTTLPDTENPYLDNPDTEAPDTDTPAQLNTKKSNTQKSNTDLSSTHSFFLPAADGMTDGFEKKDEIFDSDHHCRCCDKCKCCSECICHLRKCSEDECSDQNSKYQSHKSIEPFVCRFHTAVSQYHSNNDREDSHDQRYILTNLCLLFKA